MCKKCYFQTVEDGSEVDAFESEEDLQTYLERHWDETKLGMDWKLYKTGHVDTGEIGIIDLLAQHRNRPSWLVVELKVLKTSDQVLGQVLRYMGWVKQHLAAEDQTVDGLVIAQGTDMQTWYGLKCVPNIRMMCYRRRECALDLSEATNPAFVKAWAALDTDQQLELLEKLKRSLETE